MGLTDTDVKAKYNANGVTTTFARVHATLEDVDAETEVYTIDESTTPPTETLKTNPTHYTNVGANVSFGVAPASGLKVLVSRTVTLTQDNFEGDVNGAYPAADAEMTYDKIVAMLQWLNEKVGRTLKFRKSNTADVDVFLPDMSGNAGKVFIVNTAETGFEEGPTATEIENAQTYATNAAASATAAASSATAAASSATAAAASATAAAASAAAVAAAIVTGSATVTNAMSATSVTGMTADSASYRIAIFDCYVLRGSTACFISLVLMWDGSAWSAEESTGGGGAHGITFTLTGTTTAQVQIAADSSGNGSLRFVRRIV